MLGINLKYYYFTERMYNFFCNVYLAFTEDLWPHNEKLSKLLEKLHNFFRENHIPPKYFPSDNDVVMFKKVSKNVYPKITQLQYKYFEDSSTKKTIQMLTNIQKLHDAKFKEVDRPIGYFDEDLTDFKFMFGDRIAYEGKWNYVIKAIDEVILLCQEDEEKVKKYEYVETDSPMYEIYSFKEEELPDQE